MKKFLSHQFAALAALSSIATLITFAFGWQVTEQTCAAIPIIIGISIAFLSIGYASFQTVEKKKIQLNVSADLKLTIQQANLFQQKDIIVIGFNEYFDTHVGDGIVSPKTLHGKFINNYYKNHLLDLDNDIQASLQSQGITPIQQSCTRRHPAGKTKKYELGTCALVHDGGKQYVLVALTHFDNNDKAYLSREEFNNVLGKVMDFLSNIAEDKEVHMPILGTGLSRLNRTESRILNYIIDNIDFQHPKPLKGGLFIDILSLIIWNANFISNVSHNRCLVS